MEINWRKLNIGRWRIATFFMALLSLILSPSVLICGALFPVFYLLTLVIAVYRIVRKERDAVLETVWLLILLLFFYGFWGNYSPFARSLMGHPLPVH